MFVRTGDTWSQQAKLTASDSAPGDSFGWSTSISGDTAVIGAMYHAYYAAAYVFVRTGGTWSQQAQLTASDAGFGNSVGISGDTLLIGADAKSNFTGAAYVFVLSQGDEDAGIDSGVDGSADVSGSAGSSGAGGAADSGGDVSAAGAAGSAGSSGNGGSAGIGAPTDAGSDTGVTATPESTSESGGCGCHTTRESGSSFGALLALAVAVARHQRRRNANHPQQLHVPAPRR